MVYHSNEKTKTKEEIKEALHKCALAYEKVCDRQILFIYRGNSEDAQYHYYETYWGKENFIHLVGCKSNENISATNFYEVCLSSVDGILDEYISYKENRQTTSIKVQILPTLLSFISVKIYKMGKHDKINEKNDFDVAIGNNPERTTLGFKKYARLPIPVTTLKNPISEYTTISENVLAILTKSNSKYDTIISCVKSGIKIASLPQQIKDKISFAGEYIKLDN